MKRQREEEELERVLRPRMDQDTIMRDAGAPPHPQQAPPVSRAVNNPAPDAVAIAAIVAEANQNRQGAIDRLRVFADLDTQYEKNNIQAAGILQRFGMVTTGMTNDNMFPVLYAKARPYHKALARALNVVDPKQLATYRAICEKNYKDMVFFTGYKVKEGKRKYPIALFDLYDNNADIKIRRAVMENKDCWKAYQIHKAAPFELMTDVERTYKYASSKGFHECFFGRSQKDKKTLV